MITIDEINNMTPEEINNLNRTLGKKVMKKFIILTTIQVGTGVVIVQVVKKISENIDKED